MYVLFDELREVLKKYSYFLLDLSNENYSESEEDLSMYFLQKISFNLFSLDTLLSGVSFNENKTFDLNAISLIYRSILETSAVFNNFFNESKNKDEIDLKINLWKLSYFNSANYKFSFIDRKPYDTDSLKTEIRNNKLGVKIESSHLNNKDKFYKINKDKLSGISSTKMCDDFFIKIIGDKLPFYRNYSEESHTTYNVIRYFQVSPPENDVREVIANVLLHSYYTIDGVFNCYINYHKNELSDDLMEKYKIIRSIINQTRDNYKGH